MTARCHVETAEGAGYSLLGAVIEVTRSLRDRARVFLIGDHEDDDLRALIRAWVA
jgi:hypothetical protein